MTTENKKTENKKMERQEIYEMVSWDLRKLNTMIKENEERKEQGMRRAYSEYKIEMQKDRVKLFLNKFKG